MRVAILDERALGSVRPLDLSAYLRARGWAERDSDDRTTVWTRDAGNGDRTEVLAPSKQTWRDYARRIGAAIEQLARFEERSQLAVLSDITQASADVIRLRAVQSERSDGTIRLEDGIRLFSAMERMLISAACSTVEPKRTCPPRRPKQAAEYLRSVRLGQTERSSYVVTAVSRVSPVSEPPQRNLWEGTPWHNLFSEAQTPFERRVTKTLSTALTGIEAASQRAAATGSLDAFEEGISRGISADLCEALSSLRECQLEDGFQIGITWAPARPHEEGGAVARVAFASDSLQVIADAGRLLREKGVVDGFVLEGWVIELSRPADELKGEVTIAASIEGRPRHVVVELWGAAWKMASGAISSRSVVRCEGDLSKDSRPFRLLNPRGFELVVDRV